MRGLIEASDQASVIASFARMAGNVWSNPELTCQHVDPQTSLSPGQRATIELKLLAKLRLKPPSGVTGAAAPLR